MFRRFTMPIIEALQALGVDAFLQGRNDVVIDGKEKTAIKLLVQNK